MEIRNPLAALPSPLTQPRRETRTPGVEQSASADDSQRQRSPGNTGLTEYISRGELVDKSGLTDYRDLIRTARQQQASPSGGASAPDNGPSPYVARALSAYQDNSSDENGDQAQPRIDSRV